MVKTGDLLMRDNQKYEVLIADNNLFVVGKVFGGAYRL